MSQAESEEEKAKQQGQAQQGQVGPILFCEDDSQFRDALVAALQAAGQDVVAVESGNHLLKYIQLQPWSWMPKMVITDLVMPGMGGYQLIRRLCEMYPRRNVPVIVVSKLNSPDDIVEAELAGATVYCAKPLPISRVVENIVQIAKEGPQAGKMKFVYDLAFNFNATRA